jgi:hypothetical protein
MRYLIPILLTSVLAAHAGPPATYGTGFSERYCKVMTEAPSFPASTPLEKAVTVNSPNGHSNARVLRTDGTKIPYDDAQAHISIQNAFGDPIYISSKGFRTIDVQWIGERYLHISKGIGHIVRIEEIYDLRDRLWLLQETVTYRWP